MKPGIARFREIVNQPYYSAIECISDTMECIENAKEDFPNIELLSVFINHIERKIRNGPHNHLLLPPALY